MARRIIALAKVVSISIAIPVCNRVDFLHAHVAHAASLRMGISTIIF